MEIYSTEEQQEEAIKKAIKENWAVVLIGAIIGLGAVYGWRYYDASVKAAHEADSAAYSAVVEKIGKDDADILKLSNQYIEEHDNRSYTVMMAMVAAKEAAKNKDFDEAAKKLKWAVQNSQDESFKALNQVRLARVLIEQKKYDEALNVLAANASKAFVAQVEELKGDIYLQQGDKDKARDAYQAAVDADGLKGNNALQYKLDDLALTIPTP